MLLRAAELLDIDLSRSVMAGDKPADMEAGRRAGLSRLFLVGGGASGPEQAVIARIIAEIGAVAAPAPLSG
jgi:D-glycero-D-manno-heptose 1,7-bisphosphate phosphatase